MEDILIAEAITHEGFNRTSRTQKHDIGLIRLARAVPYTDFIRPICLPVGKLQNRNYDRHRMIVAGFGRTDTGTCEKENELGNIIHIRLYFIILSESHSRLKLKATVSGFNFSECANIYTESRIYLTESGQMCAGGEEGVGTCKGDAGDSISF